MQQVNDLLERFRIIDQQRMQGLPFYNDRLSVEAIDFQEMEEFIVGALVTPWFINIVLLHKQSPKQSIALGNKVSHQLASGEHDFMVGEDEQIGRYDFISLASPPRKYKSQQQACDYARKELQKLLSNNAQQVEEKPLTFMSAEEDKVSRREFLTGR